MITVTGLDEYQALARRTKFYQGTEYPFLGLGGETGEVLEIQKKVIRDGGGKWDHNFKLRLKKELGDVLWYLSNIAADAGLTLSEVASANLFKLQDRLERNKIHGDGDDR